MTVDKDGRYGLRKDGSNDNERFETECSMKICILISLMIFCLSVCLTGSHFKVCEQKVKSIVVSPIPERQTDR